MREFYASTGLVLLVLTINVLFAGGIVAYAGHALRHRPAFHKVPTSVRTDGR